MNCVDLWLTQGEAPLATQPFRPALFFSLSLVHSFLLSRAQPREEKRDQKRVRKGANGRRRERARGGRLEREKKERESETAERRFFVHIIPKQSVPAQSLSLAVAGVRTRAHVRTDVRILAQEHTRVLSLSLSLTHTHTYTNRNTHSNTHTHARMHARACAHRNKQINRQMCALAQQQSQRVSPVHQAVRQQDCQQLSVPISPRHNTALSPSAPFRLWTFCPTSPRRRQRVQRSCWQPSAEQVEGDAH
jgi:hypothetical protein